MKRRISGIFLVLVLVLSLCLATALPVTADNPPDKKPVSWVTAASNGNKLFPHSISSALVVKQLSDGTTVGHVEGHVFYANQTYVCDDFISSNFYDNTAEFEGYFYCKQTDTIERNKWVLTDNGEPGMYADTMVIYTDWNGVDYDTVMFLVLVNGNIQVHVGN